MTAGALKCVLARQVRAALADPGGTLVDELRTQHPDLGIPLADLWRLRAWGAGEAGVRPYYVKHRSLFFDLSVLVRTVGTVVTLRGR